MTKRLAALTPFVLGALVLTSASTLTYAAVKQSGPSSPATPAAPKTKPVIVVPDVRGQVYVFAKGILEDAGFAWNVSGAVQGYAVNTVAGQTPAPGTHVVDNGAPVVALTLARNATYGETGTPENFSPYEGNGIELPAGAKPAAKPVAKPAAKPASKPVAKPAAKPAAKPVAKPAAKPASKPASAVVNYRGGKLPSRPPAFVASGAPAEPLNEMALPDRARLLAAYVKNHPERSDAAVKHWLYQHAWLVYGAKFGWWHGAQALRTLIQVDESVQQQWGLGADSEADARAALAYVSSR